MGGGWLIKVGIFGWSSEVGFPGIKTVAIWPLETLGHCEKGARLRIEGPLPADPDRDCVPIVATLMAMLG